ncbi:helix-hairpin-helix domain-containing protein [Hymenobacter taeanensis]|uniref:Helix-hairpin-helix domain-containing protein n=1 Tax=Hymenobacter taeanensis TaxID=2735321 RepID=A0A6M6BE22_9BACT|nr:MULTISPECIES: helix-hairpin-helix domain-containing protein [Hymenobacter]QJX45964.1 helix-hairpin-helix domain-containing protein [Hymenobacter taeanensis]UOQ79811.1 helix-hairpin-helix domain-containing protein [Hymenobacter sp. 5414T-23]
MAAPRTARPTPTSSGAPKRSLLVNLQRAVRRRFGFSRRETSGFIGLVFLMLLLLWLPELLRPALPHYNPAADQARLNNLAAELAAQRQPRSYPSRYPRPAYAAQPSVPQVTLAPFNPNQLSETDWQARGLPAFLARRLVHYREVIGGFKAKEQIKRTYGLPDSVYARLAPFMQLPDLLPAKNSQQYAANKAGYSRFPARAGGSLGFTRKPTRLAAFDLNLADTTQLMQIRGIGRGYARRVVEYRQRLGGFAQEEQLAEIYSLRDAPDLVDSLRKYTFVGSAFTPATVNINSEPFEVLQAHPYIGKRLARVVVAYRQQHGPFRQSADLRPIRILDEATLTKLQPYLRFE